MDIKSKDLELWKKWKQTKSSMDLENLMKQMAGPIQNQVNRWSNVVPRFVLENEAKKLALQAFESYDPNRGVALNTHVTNWLQKLSRIAYERQATVSIPEHKRIQYNQFNRAKTQLEDVLGMPPTMKQLADHMALPEHKLKELITDVEKKEFLESEEHPDTSLESKEKQQVDFAFHDMTDMEKKVFKWKTGYEDSPIKTNAEIIKELNITQGQLSYTITLAKNKVLQAQGRK